MTTPKTNKITVTQNDKKVFNITENLELKRQLKQSARIICDYIETFFSVKNKDKLIFEIEEFKKEINFKDSRTIKTSLKQLNDLGLFIVREYKKKNFLVFINNKSNQKLVSRYDSGEISVNSVSYFEINGEVI